MIQSRGALVYGSGPGTASALLEPSVPSLMANWGYASMYRRSVWVYTLVNKLARATFRLPLKTYERTPAGRSEVTARNRLAALLRQPNPKMSRALFWAWTQSTRDVFGESMWVKLRDPVTGLPSELWPLHPANIRIEAGAGGRLRYIFEGSAQDTEFNEADIVHFRGYSPDSTARGLSALEPLRSTLENEEAARRANSAFWRKGARPSFALEHPKTLGREAQQRLRVQFDAQHAGADNTGSTVILEEGMKANALVIPNQDAQYVDGRRINREEVAAAYDVPPPVVHILDRATFSNVTEQMRSMYRDTMAPRLSELESELARSLTPEFGDRLYCEFLMEEVLRGDFEQRTEAYQKAISTGWLTINEVRALENRPPVEGGDVPMANGALAALSTLIAGRPPQSAVEAGEAMQGRWAQARSQMMAYAWTPDLTLEEVPQ